MTPDARLVLVRHAATLDDDRCHGTTSDPGLSIIGKRQARALGLRLRVLGSELGPVRRLVTSPATRAIETTAELAVALDTEPVVDERWRERHFGEWEGRPWTQLWPTTPPEVREDPTAYASWTPPGAEEPGEVAARIRPALTDALVGEGTTVVVTHAGPVRQVLAEVLEVGLATALRIDVGHARATEIGRVGEGTVLLRLGL